VKGIDVILTGHTHDALPEVKQVGKTLLVASGSNGKFLSRLDLDVAGGEVKNFAFKLIPIFSDVVSPAKDVSAKISEVRAPFEADLNTELGRVDDLLYRRGTFNGSYDDLICTALREEMEAEIALSPGFRWGTSLVPGDMMKMEDLYNATAITYPSVYKADMTGTEIKAVLEDVADNLFNEDPYYAQGGDMVRVGGLAYRINPAAKAGARISELRVLEGDVPLEASRTYKVAGWASVNENVQGPPIWEVVTSYLKSVSAAAPDKGFKVGRQSQVVVETTE
jgi:sulfur-oxidizing protein SoxB